jgi:cell wall-associated NlpC family hydrolase
MGKLVAAAMAALIVPVLLLSAAAAGVLGESSGGSAAAPAGQPGASSGAVADIPAGMLVLYQRAATAECDGLPWTVLAAIGKVESDHGRSTLLGVYSGTNPAGAMGPMQFLAATFAAHSRPVPPGGVNPPSPYDPVDAVHAAARYLCASGVATTHPGGPDLPGAVWHYDHDPAYVTHVLAIARTYAAAAAPSDAADAAAKAVAFARQQLGVPYLWGGDGPAEGGFDCSGLTRAAYATAGITIPRTADLQWHAGPAVPAGQALQPGDLLFYGTPAKATHVALFIGNNQVIHAPQPGELVQYATVWTDGFLGATRPTANDQ